jgi:hypothetical protein
MFAVAFVITFTGGASAPLANLMLSAVEGVIVIARVDCEEGFAVDFAVIVTIPAGLPSGITVGAVYVVETPLAV